MKRLWGLLLAACLLAGCAVPADVSAAPSSLPAEPSAPQPPPQTSAAALPEPPPADGCIRALAREALEKFLRAEDTPAEQVRAAYEYVVANTCFAQPVGLEIWRVRGGGETPSYLENRALSPLAYGIGSCEDYAAALCLLLEEMGFRTQYVPGITISVTGEFVDHAWCAVEMDGRWYHLDPQLEDNVMKKNIITYRYFLKSDETMLADHRWGRNLIQYARLTEEQIREVERDYLLPQCPADWPAPQAKLLEQAPPRNRGEALAAAAREIARYEENHGKLPPLELNVTPPVFGSDGYGPKDD